ncbi:MAG: ATP-dependent DNA helicase [Actinomycetia bacterium]|nr:ATP-dependent DNA helicase [Actinomycetes bacterium]MCP4087525.1 ATP-dependent DNA helicase [Actinomycetes bacterium]
MSEAIEALRRLTGALPGGGERRVEQENMADAVAQGLASERHVIVEAGTGTGKSLAYLVPALLAAKPTVVATATKALQDQLAGKDLPFLQKHGGVEFTWALLKGRANYVCRQKLDELDGDHQLGLDGLESVSTDRLDEIIGWSEDTVSGDRAELPFEPDVATWSAVSVGPRECPGRTKCPAGERCFAEAARAQAAGADVVVVNTHLYGLHLASGGAILPEHEVLIVDEAHQFEDILSATTGIELGAGRIRALARSLTSIIADDSLRAELDATADGLEVVLAPEVGRRIRRLDGELGIALQALRDRVNRSLEALRGIDSKVSDVEARKERAQQAATGLVDDVDRLQQPSDHDVLWIEGPDHRPSLRSAPLEVADLLESRLWPQATVVLTSATIPHGLGGRLGLTDEEAEELRVGSPFDYENRALLYCPVDLPDPTNDAHGEAVRTELERLILAAEGRTLGLFTSFRAMDEAADHLRPRLPWPVLTQRDLPKAALIQAFSADPHTVLLATMGFWQGVDIPGQTLSLVTIDRIPFPRPDDPLLQARREHARANGFRAVDLPRAATMLAQGAGRLIRTSTDEGVVAVLDPRLATRKAYRWELVRALPPMRRTRHRDEVLERLKKLAASDA